MKALIITYLLLCLSPLIHGQNTTTSQIVKGQYIEWQGKAAVGGYTPIGKLEIKEGYATIKNDTLMTLDIIIDMTSLVQENKQLEKHLKDKDFFHIKKYPIAQFTLLEKTFIKEGKTMVPGNMRIKDRTVTENILLLFHRKSDQINITLDHTMDRTLYNVTYNSPSIFKKLKENVIADEFIIRGSIQFSIN